MKKIILLAIAILCVSNLSAQQDVQYTQFMFNKMYFNPAYAGGKGHTCLSAIYRKQWIGITGAPESGTFTVNAPVWKKRMGIGFTLTNDRLGLTDRWNFDVSYAYRIKLKNESTLSIGLRGTLNYMTIRWDQAELTQAFDPTVPVGVASKMVPNFGAGVFYQARTWYVGFSVPRIFRNRIDFNNNSNSSIEPELQQHYFLMGGLSLDIGKNVQLQPNVMLKYIPNTPFDADINLSFVFFEKILLGVTYRLGDSVDGLIQWRIFPQLAVSLSYDFTLTPLQQYNAGSVDVMLQYCFFKKAKKLHNPRFF
jgi:type IX secretion system PorP/SprF family membrane protein